MGDTTEIVEGCLTHYDNRHIQVRIDFLGICTYDQSEFSKEKGNNKEEPNQECMAKILRLFETLTDHSRMQWKLDAMKAKEKGLSIPSEPKEYPLELSYGAIVTLIYDTFKESTVRNSIAQLLKLGYIKVYQEKKNSIPIYWLQLEYIQSLLKKQAEKKLSGVEINSHKSKVLKSTAKRPISTPEPPEKPLSGVEIEGLGVDFNDNKKGDTDDTPEERKNGVAAPSQPPNNQSSTLSVLDPDVDRLWTFYCALFKRSKPKFQDKNLAQCKQLAPYVQTQEEMNSLAEHTSAMLKAQGKADTTAYLGNMLQVNILNSWKKPGDNVIPIRSSQQKPLTGRLNATQKRMEEERLERLTQQTAIGGN